MSGDIPSLDISAAGVATLKLQRPQSANRIEPRDLDVLQELLDTIAARGPAVRAVLLTAEGPTFCGGFDLGALTAVQREGDRSTRRESGFEAFADRLAALPQPTLAVLQGPVIGGGTDLAFACDLRLGTPNASFMMPAARIGVPLYAGALHRYVQRLGLDRAKRMVLMAETIPADDLLRWGVLMEMCAPDKLAPRAAAIAAHLADLPLAQVSAMKTVLNEAAGVGPTAAQRATLHGAYDPAVIAARVAAMKAQRR